VAAQQTYREKRGREMKNLEETSSPPREKSKWAQKKGPIQYPGSCDDKTELTRFLYAEGNTLHLNTN